jgi:ribonuclease J
LVHEDEGFARTRRSLGFAGFIGVTLVFNAKGRLAAEPVLHMEGIPAAVLEPVRQAVMRAAESKRGPHGDLTEEVRIAARRAANQVWGKKPMVRVQSIEL